MGWRWTVRDTVVVGTPNMKLSERTVQRSIIGLTLLLFAVLASSVRAENPNALLSPEDAASMFNMTEPQWVENLRMVKAAGAGDFQLAPSGEYTMYTRPPPGLGVLVVTPTYKPGLETPWKLAVSTIYDAPEAAKLYNEISADEVEDLVKQAWEDMQPDFSVMGYLVRNEKDHPSIHFTIFKKGDFPPIDLMTQMGRVCPTSGGKKTCIRSEMLMH
jgi:hypothetical protein